MMKNAREKERVRLVREEYMELSAVLGDRVERGSGHFSKVSTLEAAIRCIEDLMKVRSQLVSDEALSCPSTPQDVQLEVMSPTHFIYTLCNCAFLPPQSRCEDSTDASSPDITPGINLNCDERLEPPEVHDLDNLPCPALDMSTVPPVYPAATPYFGYSSPGDFPPVTGNSSCMFPFPGSSPGLPPPSSFLCSPDLAGHTPLPTVPMTENLSPLSTSPPQHPYQCGTDVWLAIGCN